MHPDLSAKEQKLPHPEEKPRLLNDFTKHEKRKLSNFDAWSKKRRESSAIVHRTLPEAAIGPPYFYYENVALAPKGVWDTISRFQCDVEPEFVDSKYFCATARKRDYVHNLPINNRSPLLPLTPRTIHEALPLVDEEVSRKITLLGNSFQVDIVAYHLSVLKDLFPAGINLLSFFSGIRGSEVALHLLGIPLKNVVSLEISEVNRNITRSWWEQTNQKGNLINIANVQQLNEDRPEQLMNSFGGLLLIVGGSPCNNLTGSNRHSRDGLEGRESSLFYNYFRILDLVKRGAQTSLIVHVSVSSLLFNPINLLAIPMDTSRLIETFNFGFILLAFEYRKTPARANVVPASTMYEKGQLQTSHWEGGRDILGLTVICHVIDLAENLILDQRLSQSTLPF
ncbi:hypothetical protein NL676_006176 [Syzygium grande]|nr:hypothetical protein NL676_006176 [Syzygium grande]